ncbi:MAG: hypothetical protein ACHP6I_02430 [Rickettsiales bacterium]
MKEFRSRRTDTEKNQVGDYYTGPDRYYDQVQEKTIVKIYSGGCYSTATTGELIVTILGSCIACCMHDPVLKIGGMNHFLLPGDNNSATSARFGIHSMELLINELLKKGAIKSRLEVKIFGGARVMQYTQNIGDKNIEFVKGFITKEKLLLTGEDVGGLSPRRLHFFPDSGKVMLRKLQRVEDLRIVEREKEYLENIKKQTDKKDDDVTLF